MSRTLSSPFPPGLEEDGRFPHHRILEPFFLTLMNTDPRRPVFWLWSRRHKHWVIDQVLNLKIRRFVRVAGSIPGWPHIIGKGHGPRIQPPLPR